MRYRLARRYLGGGEIRRRRLISGKSLVADITIYSSSGITIAINEVIMDKILILRKESYICSRGIYIDMRRQVYKLDPMSYTYTESARDS